MLEADEAPLRRISEAALYRDRLMLAVAATLPERARALAALEFGVTVFLEPDGVIRIAISGEALKLREGPKARQSFHARLHRPSLHRALSRWRAAWRPMFDDGSWLWPSRLDREHGLTQDSTSVIAGRVTRARLDRRASLHLVRDCVATEIVETDPVGGAVRAAGVLRHRDQATTSDFYCHAKRLSPMSEAARPGIRAVVESPQNQIECRMDVPTRSGRMGREYPHRHARSIAT